MTRLPEMFDDLAREARLYDVTERALTMSRRRRTRRRVVTAAAATTAVCVAVSVVIGLSLAPTGPQAPLAGQPTASTAPAGLPGSCLLEHLALPAGHTGGVVSGGDPTGRILVGYAEPGLAVIWVDGQLQEIPQPPGWQGNFNDVNSRGLAVGSSQVTRGGSTVSQAWTYRDGKYTPLKGGDNTTAVAVNEQGMIVGGRDGRPVIWPGPDAEPRELPMHAGAKFGPAGELDEDGTAAGTLSPAMPHVWAPDGTLRELPHARVVSSMRNGWITGVSTDNRAVRWNLRTGAMQRLSGDLSGPLTTVNALGWTAGATGEYRMRIADTEGHIDLPPGVGRVVLLADDGRTAAGIIGVEARATPVMWRCS